MSRNLVDFQASWEDGKSLTLNDFGGCCWCRIKKLFSHLKRADADVSSSKTLDWSRWRKLRTGLHKNASAYKGIVSCHLKYQHNSLSTIDELYSTLEKLHSAFSSDFVWFSANKNLVRKLISNSHILFEGEDCGNCYNGSIKGNVWQNIFCLLLRRLCSTFWCKFQRTDAFTCKCCL